MTIFTWFLGLFFLLPKPSDLKAEIPSKWKSFKNIQATFWLGIVLCVAFLVFSNGTFDQINDNWFAILGINNVETFTPWWFVQMFTHNFIHINFLHLLTNLSVLGILSLYERNVCAKRFLSVFLFAGILSSFSILFISEEIISTGASAGLLGLGAAYFLDNPKLTMKEYAVGIILIFFTYLMLGLQAEKEIGENFNTDELGHIFGLILGVIYGKLLPRKTN